MHHSRPHRFLPQKILLPLLLVALAMGTPDLAMAQASPFMTGATSLQTNLLAWLTPVAIILVMVLGGMAMANRIAQVSSTYGQSAAQTLVENCANTLILRCSGSENGGTSQFASRLIGDREILRRQVSRGSDRESPFSARGARRSRSFTEQHATETAVMPSELEQLPDLCGYLKTASSGPWLKVAFGDRLGPERRRPC
ncbi:MAG TPA: type IV secretion system DNA-binding domain-containing protein [Steroidobacteraceae bacterium]